ncbi:hypothetical protein [Lignipirellula cremea]|uniref:hypothetical protein n=1 Tax=Lignipirellula cremea TaxID=2528010 RepID=UPI00119D6CC6|nr:hypothetical protein [Lignipirellula cremea]
MNRKKIGIRMQADGDSWIMKYQISAEDFKDSRTTLSTFHENEPTAAARCLIARRGWKGRLSLRVKFVEGLDRPFTGQIFQVVGDPEKLVRFVSTSMSHGDPDPDRWFMLMHVEPVNCECSDLDDNYLVSFEKRTTG